MGDQTLQQKTTRKGRKNSQLQDLQRQVGGGECIWNISEQIQGTTEHYGTKAKGCFCQRHIDKCGVVAQHAEKTHEGRADRIPSPANDVAALQNKQMENKPNDNYRNSLRKAKHQQDLLKGYSHHVGTLGGQEDRICDGSYNWFMTLNLYVCIMGLCLS